MKRRDEREGVLDAKPCDWQAAKGSRALAVKAVLGEILDYAVITSFNTYF